MVNLYTSHKKQCYDNNTWPRSVITYCQRIRH